MLNMRTGRRQNVKQQGTLSMKRNLFISAALLAALMLLLAAAAYINPARAEQLPAPIQTYNQSRYALASAVIDVANLQNPGTTCTRNAVFRIDTATGNVAILQLSIRGDNDPTVMSAAWAPAGNSNNFSPYANTEQQTQQQQ